MNSRVVKVSSWILKISSIGFILAACYHVLAIFIDLNNSVVWRNLLFVAINAWCAFETRRLKPYFIVVFTILFVQQLFSHGSSVIRNLHDHRFDWLGVFVLAAITIIYLALIVSAIDKFKVNRK